MNARRYSATRIDYFALQQVARKQSRVLERKGNKCWGQISISEKPQSVDSAPEGARLERRATTLGDASVVLLPYSGQHPWRVSEYDFQANLVSAYLPVGEHRRAVSRSHCGDLGHSLVAAGMPNLFCSGVPGASSPPWPGWRTLAGPFSWSRAGPTDRRIYVRL